MLPVSVCLGIKDETLREDAYFVQQTCPLEPFDFAQDRLRREIPWHYPSVASRDSSTTLRSARNDSNFMNERYIKWYTPYLSREFEMLVFGEKRGAGMIGITGATCCHIICRNCEAPVLSHFINLELSNLSFRAEFRRAKHSRGISNCF
jgi:hypothetical protein